MVDEPKPARRRPTLADVAARSGVSVTTASFVLAGRTDMRIASTTAARVTEAARDLRYHRAPRAHRSTPTGLAAIGYVADDVASDPFGGDMLRAAMLAAADLDHGVLATYSQGTRSIERDSLRDLLSRGITKFVYAKASTRRIIVPELLRTHRTMLLNCVDRRSGAPAVVPDERAGAAVAVTALLEAGHTDRIWLVGEAVLHNPYAPEVRRASIERTLAQAGLALSAHIPCRWGPVWAREAVLEHLREHRPPTAVIAMNDRVAMGVYQAAAQAGLSIPHDVSVVSFDDSELASWMFPALTSVRLPLEEMSQLAVERLLARDDPSTVSTLPMPLTVRDSVTRPP